MSFIKKKVLIITKERFWPLAHGGAIAQYYFLEKLRHEIDFTVITNARNKDEITDLNYLIHQFPEVKFILYHEVKRSNNFINNTIGILRAWNRKFFQQPKVQIGEILFGRDITWLDNTFISFCLGQIKKSNYDFIQVEFFELITLIPLFSSYSKVLFVHHEIRFKKLILAKSADENVLYRDYVSLAVQTMETSFIKKAHKVIVFNRDDFNLFNAVECNSVLSPFGIPDQLIESKDASNDFDRFLIMGSETHLPNLDGLCWFLDNIYIPNYDLISWPVYIVGNWSEKLKMSYKKYRRIIFKGFVNDLSEYYSNSVLLTPILYGSGLRTKILLALANRVPVWSTTFACEGIYSDDSKVVNKPIWIFNNAKDFIRLYYKSQEDKFLLTNLSSEGNILFRRNFNTENLSNLRLSVYS
jgi:hypothetical protein